MLICVGEAIPDRLAFDIDLPAMASRPASRAVVGNKEENLFV